MAEIYQLKGENLEALKLMQKIINTEAMSFNFKSYSLKKIRFLFEQSKKNNVFKEMIKENIEWISEYTDLLKDLFYLSDPKVITQAEFF